VDEMMDGSGMLGKGVDMQEVGEVFLLFQGLLSERRGRMDGGWADERWQSQLYTFV
jgi:hypothetical protein